MFRRINQSLLVILVACTTSICWAQPRAGGFAIPDVGTMLPDVSVYDADGKRFSTGSIRGEYAVIVFGCLT